MISSPENSHQGIDKESQTLLLIELAKKYVILLDRLSKERVVEQRKDELKQLLQCLTSVYASAISFSRDSFEEYDDFLIEKESIVTEELYNYILEQMYDLMGVDNVFLDFEIKEMQYSDQPIAVNSAELMADIHQEFANAVWAFGSSLDEDFRYTVVRELLNAFHQEWGEKLLMLMRILHRVLYASNDEFDVHTDIL